MLWIPLFFTLFIGDNTHQEVKLKLSSAEYYFRSGSIILFRSDIGLSNELRPPKDAQDVINVPLANGYSDKVAVSRPGLFTVMIGNLEVVRIGDKKQFQVTHLLVRDFEITEQNLKSGLVEIPIKARGVYRVIALDRNEKPVPGVRMYLFNAEEGVELKTNSEGEIIFLGSPNDYHMEVLPEGSAIRLKILPL